MESSTHVEANGLAERLEAVTRDRSPREQIQELCQGASDEEFVEIAKFIRSQPEVYPDSGGSMACDEMPGWRESMWSAFGSAAIEEGKARFATTALSEMGHHSHSTGDAQRLAQEITDCIPYS